jgi:hypothetical protein
MRRHFWTWGLIALAAAGPAAAQPDAEPPAAGCEFHAWPSDRLMSVYYGLFYALPVRGALGRANGPAVPAEPIDLATQRTLLSEAQPQRLLGQSDYRLIVHENALPARVIRTTAGRLTGSPADCYAELVVDDMIVQRDLAHGSVLRILFRYRDFGAGAAPRRSFATWTQTRLRTFPPREAEQLPAAIAEIRAAYRQGLILFAGAASRPPRQALH